MASYRSCAWLALVLLVLWTTCHATPVDRLPAGALEKHSMPPLPLARAPSKDAQKVDKSVEHELTSTEKSHQSKHTTESLKAHDTEDKGPYHVKVAKDPGLRGVAVPGAMVSEHQRSFLRVGEGGSDAPNATVVASPSEAGENKTKETTVKKAGVLPVQGADKSAEVMSAFEVSKFSVNLTVPEDGKRRVTNRNGVEACDVEVSELLAYKFESAETTTANFTIPTRNAEGLHFIDITAEDKKEVTILEKKWTNDGYFIAWSFPPSGSPSFIITYNLNGLVFEDRGDNVIEAMFVSESQSNHFHNVEINVEYPRPLKDSEVASVPLVTKAQVSENSTTTISYQETKIPAFHTYSISLTVPKMGIQCGSMVWYRKPGYIVMFVSISVVVALILAFCGFAIYRKKKGGKTYSDLIGAKAPLLADNGSTSGPSPVNRPPTRQGSRKSSLGSRSGYSTPPKPQQPSGGAFSFLKRAAEKTFRQGSFNATKVPPMTTNRRLGSGVGIGASRRSQWNNPAMRLVGKGWLKPGEGSKPPPKPRQPSMSSIASTGSDGSRKPPPPRKPPSPAQQGGMKPPPPSGQGGPKKPPPPSAQGGPKPPPPSAQGAGRKPPPPEARKPPPPAKKEEPPPKDEYEEDDMEYSDEYTDGSGSYYDDDEEYDDEYDDYESEGEEEPPARK